MVAIAKGLYDSNDGGYCNQVCCCSAAGVQPYSILFQWVEIESNGKRVHAKVRDSCQSCGESDLGEKWFMSA